MACFYVATTRYKGDGILKFGISKFNDPVRRLNAHGSTLDNPFGAKLPSFVLCSWILIDDLYIARAIENAIKQRVLSLPHLRSRLLVVGGETASGEWLSFEQSDLWSAVWELLSLSVGALAPNMFSAGAPDVRGLSEDERKRAFRVICKASERWYADRLILSYDDVEDVEDEYEERAAQ